MIQKSLWLSGLFHVLERNAWALLSEEELKNKKPNLMCDLVFGAERGSTRIKRTQKHEDRSDDGMWSGKFSGDNYEYPPVFEDVLSRLDNQNVVGKTLPLRGKRLVCKGRQCKNEEWTKRINWVMKFANERTDQCITVRVNLPTTPLSTPPTVRRSTSTPPRTLPLIPDEGPEGRTDV